MPIISIGPNISSEAQIKDGTIVNADINASAGVVESKLAFDTVAGHNHDGVTSRLLLAVPTGAITMWSTASAPTGYLLCDGTAVSRTTYATLFALISTAYGVGDGSTTFNVPNLKGKVPVGFNSAETEFNVLGETGGAKTHTLTTTEMPSHTHTFDHNSSSGGGTGVVSNGNAPAGTKTTNSAGSGGAHNNLQPYLTLNFIIKV